MMSQAILNGIALTGALSVFGKALPPTPPTTDVFGSRDAKATGRTVQKNQTYGVHSAYGLAHFKLRARQPKAAVLPSFQRIHDRMLNFGVTQQTVNRVWNELLNWHEQLENECCALPAPAVFCNERSEIEFEWERGSKSLIGVALSDGGYEITRLDGDDEQTETLASTQVVDELKWFLS